MQQYDCGVQEHVSQSTAHHSCVVGMVAEDIDRLEKQMRGESAQWILLSVSNNCLYDDGISKLVQVLRCIGRPSLTSCHVKFRVLLSTTNPNMPRREFLRYSRRQPLHLRPSMSPRPS